MMAVLIEPMILQCPVPSFLDNAIEMRFECLCFTYEESFVAELPVPPRFPSDLTVTKTYLAERTDQDCL